MAGRVLEIGIVTGDRVESFQNVACKKSLGVFGRFISHEAVNEGPTGGCSYNAAERCVEEIRVVAN